VTRPATKLPHLLHTVAKADIPQQRNPPLPFGRLLSAILDAMLRRQILMDLQRQQMIMDWA
jgi:hypothetical protein